MPTLSQGLDVQLILHIGMHKTTSTTIQKRLKDNNLLLHNYKYPYIAKECKTLLKAFLQRNFKPWRELSLYPRKTDSTPIVFHEALSHVLCRGSSATNASCLGDWLLRKLCKAVVKVKIIGFVRDQPAISIRVTRSTSSQLPQRNLLRRMPQKQCGDTSKEAPVIKTTIWLAEALSLGTNCVLSLRQIDRTTCCTTPISH